MSLEVPIMPPEEKTPNAVAEPLLDGINELAVEPLSPAQQRLWFVSRLEPQSALYNVPSALRLGGALNTAALEQSLRAVVDRHEILRTVYGIEDGQPVQRILASGELDFETIDLTAAPDREKEVQRQLEREAARPFDLERDPVLRAALYRLAAEDHVLFVNMHHIACDEWSMGVFFRELASFYDAFSHRNAPGVEELPIQYADFACWQRDWIEQGGVSADLAYWRQKLAAPLPVLEVPADRKHPVTTEHAGDRAQITLDAGLAESVRALARREAVTPFILLLTAFKTLLHRYTGQTDVLIGTPISGRNKVETESLIGFFVNMISLRTELRGDIGFRHALARVRETTLGAFAHQEIPFEQLVEQLRPERNSTHSPFFNTIFALQVDSADVRIPGLKTTVMDVYNHTAKFDLNLTIEDFGREMRVIAEYNTDIFDRARIERMLVHFQQLLQGIIAHPEEAIGQLPLLTPQERHQVLIQWNQTATEFPKDQCVQTLFEKQAAATPEARALDFPEAAFSYRELNERANQIAHYLRRHGIRPGMPVGICVERSAEMIAGILGILKAGGYYLPLDTSYPPERIEFMARDAAAPLVLVHKRLSLDISFAGQTVCLDRDAGKIARESTVNPENLNRPEDPAYVIYTSGSTGIPKGICIPHRAINRLVFNTNYVQFGPTERIAQISNASFDAATFEIWGSLLLGGQLIGFEKETILSPKALAAALREKKITSLFLTVALFNQVAAEIPDAFSSVKNLLVGGDALEPAAIRRVLQHGPPARLLNGYGPTECTTFALWHLIEKVEDWETHVPIGKPLSNTQIYILDPNREPTPVGVPGELYLGGDGLAIGYLNRPELNAEKFVANPFSENPQSRLYRTGDLARFREDGVVEFLGRTDDQVKIRGFRIELGEIEAVLSGQTEVRETAVMVRQDVPGEKRIVAYLVLAAGVAAPPSWKEKLRQKLPDYMIPSAFVVLPKLPLTPNGKVDRRALPAPEAVREDASRSLPRNNIELRLVKLWEKVLNVPRIGIFDNFFELGGHSLLAVRLFAEIEGAFGKTIGISTLFQAPTIETLARVISSGAYSAPGSCVVEVQPKGPRAPVFWLHTLGGGGGSGLFTYRGLAEFLGSDQPSYGIVAPATPHTSIEEMAAHYVRELKTYQPAGPYNLGGYCFGGIVAYEMASQLLEQGEEVSFLGLIDSLAPNVPDDFNLLHPAHLLHLGSHLLHWGKGLTQRSGADWSLTVKKYIGAITRPFRRRSAASDLGAVIDTTNYPPDFKRTAEVHWEAVQKYRPKPFPGKMILFRARYRSLSGVSPTLRWGSLVENLRVVPVSAKHDKILEPPHVLELAKVMKHYLGNSPTPPAAGADEPKMPKVA